MLQITSTNDKSIRSRKTSSSDLVPHTEVIQTTAIDTPQQEKRPSPHIGGTYRLTDLDAKLAVKV